MGQNCGIYPITIKFHHNEKKNKNAPFSLVEENRKSNKSKSSDATGMYGKWSQLWYVADSEALLKPQDIFDYLIFDILREAEQV